MGVDYHHSSGGSDGRYFLSHRFAVYVMAKDRQVAALPWRQRESGVEILLVTTRTTKRWLIPKGWTMEGTADYEAAAIEAYEEAGVRGVVEAEPLGQYGYVKLMQSGKARHVNVQVFKLAVFEILEDWPECADRQRRWVQPAEALALIGEPELFPVIEAFEKSLNIGAKPSRVEKGVIERVKRWWRGIS
jgi:8-oxo-dGTP pyrophosphatase MutT (NUDIX family)